MSTRAKLTKLLMFLIIGITAIITNGALAASITLYTPYTKVSVPPGESLDYSIEVKNSGSEVNYKSC